MVAISLYKGNLHKVPDIPRRWPRPEATISLQEFRILIRRRAKTLARLQCPSDEPAATSSPSSIPTAVDVANVEYSGGSLVVNHADDLGSEPASHQVGDSRDGDADSKVLEAPIGEDSSGKLGMKADEKNEEAEIHVTPPVRYSRFRTISSTEEAIREMEKSKEEIKEKLEELHPGFGAAGVTGTKSGYD
ncbi:hypothetical protein M569_01317 [Genlisea aurea]|uniref:Uncharacterized protein n=1 Tax=Genlisea aurea TaxID=192259 RepID=S8D109_9LAMI|nr:hypothetical protein M569_01317 [Genlisea aurea]